MILVEGYFCGFVTTVCASVNSRSSTPFVFLEVVVTKKKIKVKSSMVDSKKGGI